MEPRRGPWEPGTPVLVGLFTVVFLCLYSCLLGLGSPHEGPEAPEAIANGCAFQNPKFNPGTQKQQKQTFLSLASQLWREVSIYKTHSTFTRMNGTFMECKEPV